MLEISIMCVIALAGVYWMALFLMGRREDVLHGDFIRAAQSAAAQATPQPGPRAALPRPLPQPTIPVLARPAPPQPIKPPKPARRIDPMVTVKTIDPVRPVQLAESTQPVASAKSRAAPARPGDMVKLPGPAVPGRGTAPPWRRSRAPDPAPPESLQSLLETIKRDLGDAVSG